MASKGKSPSQHKDGMHGIILTEKGLEHTAAAELKELIGAEAEEREQAVLFPVQDIREFCTLCYRSQSANRILSHLATFSAAKDLAETMKNLGAAVKRVEYLPWLEKGITWRVSCERHGVHNYSSIDVEASAGEIISADIKKKTGKKPAIAMEEANLIFTISIINEQGFLGIDLCGKELGKREYKIFLHPQAIKGTLAYALLRTAGYKKNDLLLDPFCGSGTIPIEAALWKAGISPRYYAKEFQFMKLKPFKNIDFKACFEKMDKNIIPEEKKTIFGYDKELRNLKASAKNAKIAGVEKYIDFSKLDIEWLDTKFKKESIHKIITHPPQETRNTNRKELEKTYHELFHQAAFVLKKNGTITVLMLTPDLLIKHAKAYTFSVRNRMQVFSGKQAHQIITFQKENR
ncbi:MAG: hypothetical protein V1743_00740 [Nanoarchaeota archaeon]